MNSKLIEAYKKNISIHISLGEYEAEINRFIYISRLIRRYKNNKTTNYRLLLNHLIIAYNCFGNEATDVLLVYVDEEIIPELFGVLRFLYRLPPALMDKEYNSMIIQDIEDNINGN